MAQCNITEEQVNTILQTLEDIATRVGLMDGKIDVVDGKVDTVKGKIDETIATLALKETVKMICGRCKGTKKCIISYPGNPVTNVEEDCPQCGGTGFELFGEANENS